LNEIQWSRNGNESIFVIISMDTNAINHVCNYQLYYLICFLTSLYIQFGNKGGSDIECNSMKAQWE
jgi:hypothetical protein